VRAYDATSSQWSTPDAYAGKKDDPLSQKPFMWSGSNPLAYSDPSGYLIDFSQNANPDQAKQDYTDTMVYFLWIGDAEAYNTMNDVLTNPTFSVGLIETSTLDENSPYFDNFSPGNKSADSNKGNGTIYWNPHAAVAGYDHTPNHSLSPAVNLLHETTHAYDWGHGLITDSFMGGDAGNFDNPEDRRVETGVEAHALEAMGLPPRTDHDTGHVCYVPYLASTVCP